MTNIWKPLSHIFLHSAEKTSFLMKTILLQHKRHCSMRLCLRHEQNSLYGGRLSSGYLGEINRIYLHGQTSALEVRWIWVNSPFKQLQCPNLKKITKSKHTAAMLNTTHTWTWMEQVWRLCVSACAWFLVKVQFCFYSAVHIQSLRRALEWLFLSGDIPSERNNHFH